ncbi:MAG: cellulase family glycosylhydrolase [Chitinophagaceae bacterium]|nr:cellulase family glycosylhydrolase [Chitinophagaceae bacterium]
MKKIFIVNLLITLFFSLNVCAQLPTAQSIASNLKIGWNMGNTLEAICSATAWGGVATTQQLVNAVKAAGFNTVRLPCAWDCHATNGVIDPNWMATVKQSVDYFVNANMYVILNIHWDNGWLENNVTTAAQASVNAKQQNYWTQIANYFKGYNEHLLFASANEPNASDATGMSVLLSYHQTFVNAVRATGGNNSSRTLIIQGPQTNIGLTNTLMNTLPTDQIAGRMMVEVHYYEPYQFSLMTQDADWGKMFYYWGTGYHSATDVTRNSTWGEESYIDSSFNLMKTKFVDKGIPVIIGEFAAVKRTLSPPSDQTLHLASRQYFYRYVVSAAKSRGIIPYVWDINQGIYDRATATVLDQGILDAMNQGSGVAYMTFTNRASGLLIDGMGRTTNGTATGQWSNSGSNNQQWIMESMGRYIRLRNRATGIYIDGMYNYTNGAAAGQWSSSGSDAQQWLLQPSGTYYTISNKATGQYLDGIYRSANGSDLGQWSNSGSTAQQWTVGTVGHVQVTSSTAAAATGQAGTLTNDQGNGSLQLYPNPFKSTFSLTIDNPDSVKNIAIFDLAGKQVELIGHPDIANQMSIGASLNPGAYIVKIYGINRVQSFKVIKIN